MISFSQYDKRSCPKCGSDVNTELWIIIDKDERSKLWSKCIDGSIHNTVCTAGHIGNIRAPLLLVDRNLKSIIFSPEPGTPHEFQEADYNYLIEKLIFLSSIELNVFQFNVFTREIIPLILTQTQRKFLEFAPGVQLSPNLEELYNDLRNASIDKLRQVSRDFNEISGFAAAVKYELSIHLSDQGLFDDAITELNSALQYYTLIEFPKNWGMIRSDLGFAYHKRIDGNDSGNNDEALEQCLLANEVLQKEIYPEEFALNQSRLANIYMDRYSERPESLKKGIEAYKHALEIFNPKLYPTDWANVQLNFATALIEKNTKESIFLAIEHLQAIINFLPEAIPHINKGIVYLNLGAAFDHLIVHNTANKIDGLKSESVEAFRQAFNILNNSEENSHLLSARYNLGISLSRIKNIDSLKEAASLLQICRKIYFNNSRNKEYKAATSTLAKVFLDILGLNHDPELLLQFSNEAYVELSNDSDDENIALLFLTIAGTLLKYKPVNTEVSMNLAKDALLHSLFIWRMKYHREYRAHALKVMGELLMDKYFINNDNHRLLAKNYLLCSIEMFKTLEQVEEKLSMIGDIHQKLMILEE